jgi:hypothetical protein
VKNYHVLHSFFLAQSDVREIVNAVDNCLRGEALAEVFCFLDDKLKIKRSDVGVGVD